MRPTMAMTGLLELPEHLREKIIFRLSPADACRLDCVSTACRFIVDSDRFWDRFLPPQCLAAIPDLAFLSRKQLYLRACDNPVLINDGKLSLWLDKPSGKKCYMISAGELTIVWGDNPEYWRWIQLPEARFPEVAGKISTSILSPRTTYVFYLVFKPINDPYRFEDNLVYGFVGNLERFEGNLDRFEDNLVYGFDDNPVEVTVGLADSVGPTRTVYLDPMQRRLPADDQVSFPEERGDGWFESELGEYFYGGDEDGELSMTIKETERLNWKSGLVFQGIEIRPKRSK